MKSFLNHFVDESSIIILEFCLCFHIEEANPSPIAFGGLPMMVVFP